MNFLISLLLKLPVAGRAVSLLAKGYLALTGKKTQLTMGLGVLVWLLGFFGVLDKDAVEQILVLLGPAASAFFLEKLGRHKDLLARLGSAVQREALDAERSSKAALDKVDAAASEALRSLGSDGKS